MTPPVGDASAGRASTGLCAECHGNLGISVAPGIPSLAGQDAQYLADAIHAYKAGARQKTIPCGACHGDNGISRKPGIPNLAGLSPQYLGHALKAYASGKRKNGVMNALLSGVDDAQLNGMALYYAQQNPAQAQTQSVGNSAAGKTAAALCVGCHGETSRQPVGCDSEPCRPGRALSGRVDQGLQERRAPEGDRLRRLPWRARHRRQAGSAEPCRPEPPISGAGAEGLCQRQAPGQRDDGADVGCRRRADRTALRAFIPSRLRRRPRARLSAIPPPARQRRRSASGATARVPAACRI